MENSKIEWTDHTFNPWIGCTKVGPGCDNCYAEDMMDRRYGRVTWGAGNPRQRTSEANWRKPLAWNRAAEGGPRPRVFCASLADVFDNDVPHAWRQDLFDLIGQTANLDWLLLTKRIGNVKNMVLGGMPSNVWLGATVVNQEEADRDIPKLLAAPARVRFLSMEPLLGPVNLARWLNLPRGADRRTAPDWVIVGGESGSSARPMHPDWARTLRDQCATAGVAFHFKQWGAWQPIDQGAPDWYADIYRSNRIARDGEDQAALDECWGKHCTVEKAVVHIDGSVHSITDSNAFLQGTYPMTTYRVGKKRAGRELDGRTHDQFPLPG